MFVKMAKSRGGNSNGNRSNGIEIRCDFPYSAFSLTDIGRFITEDRGKQLRSWPPCLHFVACKSKRITMRTH